MTGAKLQANDIVLDAAKNINLIAAQNTAKLQSQNSASSAGIGVTFGFGEQSGISFQLGANKAKGQGNGSETTYDNTQVTATNNLTLKSGNDTNLIGAQVAAKTVTADIGGNLNIQSLQDSSSYESKQGTSGFGVSVCIPPFCYGTPVTGSVSASKQNIDHNYQSTTGQSGIAAGTGGFDIQVAGATDLKGAAITSEADKSKNTLSTSALTYSDLANQQNTNANSSSFSVGYGGGSMVSTLASNLTSNLLANAAGGAGLPKNGSESSTTQSVISPATVTITGTGNAAQEGQSAENVATLTSRDASTANGSLKNTLTLQQAQELQAQQQKAQENAAAAQLVGAVITNVIGHVAQEKGWAEGSWQKTALHGLAGAIQAKIAGTSALSGAAVGVVNEQVLLAMENYLVSQDIRRYNADGTPNADFNALLTAGSALLGTAVGALTGGSSGAGTGAVVAANATINNRLLHENEKAKIKELANGDADREQKLADASCYLTHCSAGKADSDPVKQSLVEQEARGKGYIAEIALLQNTDLFKYTDADRRLDSLNALDTRNISALNAQELQAKSREIALCRQVDWCEQGVKARYDRLTSERTETVLTSVNVMKSYDQCGPTDTSCLAGSLVQMKAQLLDLKAKGVKIEDAERIGLSAYISNAEVTLRGFSYEAFGAIAQAAIGVTASNAGNAGNNGIKPGATGSSNSIDLTFDKNTRTWKTPAGLEYGPGSIEGNRVMHVLEHATPDPSKATHSVFNVDRKNVLGLVDEAWIGKGNPLPNDPGAYIVQMGRVIGTAGETSIKIIVRPGTNKIITAYPIP